MNREPKKQYLVETNNTFGGETVIVSSYKDPEKAVIQADSIDLLVGTWVIVSEWLDDATRPKRLGTYYRRDF